MKSLLYSALILSMLGFSGCAASCGGGACAGGGLLQAMAAGGGGRLQARRGVRASMSDAGCDACGGDELVSMQPCGGSSDCGCGESTSYVSSPAVMSSAPMPTGNGVNCQLGDGMMGGRILGGGPGMGLALNEKGSACRAEGTSRIGGGQFRSMIANALPTPGGCRGCGGSCGAGGCRLKHGGGGGGCGLLSKLKGGVGGLGAAGGIGGGLGGGPYGGQIPHTAQVPGAGTGMAPAYAYPYYTTRGPRDFLNPNPPSIGY